MLDYLHVCSRIGEHESNPRHKNVTDVDLHPCLWKFFAVKLVLPWQSANYSNSHLLPNRARVHKDDFVANFEALRSSLRISQKDKKLSLPRYLLQRRHML